MMGFGIACMVIGAGFVAAWAWMGVQAWRDDRAAGREQRESAERFEADKPEIEAAMARSAARIPKPPITEAEVEQLGADAVDELEAYSNQGYIAATPQRLRASVLDDHALQNPMPKRPAPPAAAPAEPWQLRKNDPDARLVELGESDNNSLEQS